MKESKSTKIVIEKAQKSDLKSIIELYKQLNSEVNFDEIDSLFLDSYFEDFKSLTNCYLYVLKVGDKVESTCLFSVTPNLAQGFRPNGIIESFVTNEKSRRKGYGKQLIEYILDLAKDLNCVKVSLLTKNDNETANIYENIGFKENLKRSFVYLIE